MIELNGKVYCECCFEDVGGTGGICPKCGANPDHNRKRFPASLSEGQILGTRYVVGKALGQGGFGITYLCFDLKKGIRVTVKEFFPATLCHRDSGTREIRIMKDKSIFVKGMKRFYEEARLVAKFRGNPYIVSVTEFFYQNKTAYFVMEYLQGCDLTHYIAAHNLDEITALRVMRCVLCGLDAMHGKNVLHRDISPNNIFICADGSIKLIDFGAARVKIGDASNSLSVILNPGFAPLEQYRSNGNQGPWTDIFATGASLYYTLKRKVMPSAVERLSNDSVDFSGISDYVVHIIKKMTALKPEQRYQKAAAAVADIDAVIAGMGKNPVQSRRTGGTSHGGSAQQGIPQQMNTGTGTGNTGSSGQSTGGSPSSTGNGTQSYKEKEKLIRIICIVCSAAIAIAAYTAILLLLL